MKFNIPEDEAVERLIDLIREHGKWIDRARGRAGRSLSPASAMSDTLTELREDVSLDVPWNVIVHDDPVNLMEYVTWTLMKIFGYPRNRATAMMLEVHKRGRSVVWSGDREKSEFYAQQLQAHQLKTSLEKAE